MVYQNYFKKILGFNLNNKKLFVNKVFKIIILVINEIQTKLLILKKIIKKEVHSSEKRIINIAFIARLLLKF
uniref:Uncharacterized protein n=1 Tax=Strongyloides venezuelensis TaxID=75913 RepID=A0A0K0FXR0_STRVS